MNNIVIVGGGAAGWMTALYVKKIYPKSNVTVVASSEIGILGAGESTTPMFIDFLDILEIPFKDIISNCGAAIKVTARFTNWKGDNSYYYNPFAADGDLAISELNAFVDPIDQYNSRAFIYSIGKKENQADFDFNAKLAENNRFPFSKNKQRLAHFSLNFDASLTAKYLQDLAINERGVLFVDDEVLSFSNDENGNLSSVIAKNNTIEADFVFDCSGFKRLIIGNHYKSEWISYKDNLSTDSAVPFFLTHDQINRSVVPYINAQAMKYGWMWQIPLQHRYGCGYVFDSSLINIEEAKKEIEEMFGFKPHYPRGDKPIIFNAGYHKYPWVKNSIAVGLAAGFIEPLESTSILSALQILKMLPKEIDDLIYPKDYYMKYFNDSFAKDQAEILDFILLHYITVRDDTEFWKNFEDKHVIPDSLKNILEKNKNGILKYEDFEDTRMFALENYIYVLQGNGMLNEDAYVKEYKDTYSDEENKNYAMFKIKQDLSLQASVDWQSMLDMVNE